MNMALEKTQKTLINSSHDVTMITKPTSTISQSYIDDYYPNLNLSFSQTEKSKLRNNDYPVLKRSQSHKRHHFKVDIRTIVNEELNEDDSENITIINSCQDSFSSSESDLEIITNFTAPCNINIKDDNSLSPKTKIMINNLLIDTNKKEQYDYSHFFLEEDNEFKLFNNKNGEYLGHDITSSPEYSTHEINDINNEVIGIIPTIMGRIMKQEAISIENIYDNNHDNDNNLPYYKSTNNEF